MSEKRSKIPDYVGMYKKQVDKDIKNHIKTHGGSRPGSGRKPGPETKTISFRVKLDQIEIVREAVRKVLTPTKPRRL